MTQAQLFQALKSIGFPVAYSHFEEDDSPPPPFITYLFSNDDDFKADNINYHSISNFQVELYTTIKDLSAEKQVENKLKELKLPYSKTEVWIDDEKLFQIMYEIQI